MKRKFLFILFLISIISVYKLTSPTNASANYWIHQFGDPDANDGASGITTDSQDVYVVGNFGSLSPCGAFVKRYDLYGNEVWSRAICDNEAYDIAVSNNAVFVSGLGYLKKFDKDGNSIWSISILGSGTSVALDTNNNVYVGGKRYIYKFDSSGNQVWNRTYTLDENTDNIALAIKGNMLAVAGSAYGVLQGQTKETPPGTIDGFVQTFDLDGNIIWTRQIANQPFRTITLDGNGNIYPAGTNSGAGGYIYKFDQDGNQVWQTLDGTDLKDIKATSLGLYTVGGNGPIDTTIDDNHFYVYFKHYDTNGNILWTKIFGTKTTNPAGTSPEALAVDGGQFYIVGLTLGALPGQNSAGDEFRDAFIKACTEENCEPTPFYLHDRSTLSLDNTAPTNPALSSKSSSNVGFANGNPWVEVGIWQANPTITIGNLQPLSDLKVWIGLKNNSNVGTNFDLKAEVYKNNTLLTAGEARCINGLTAGANSALRTYVVFPSFSSTSFDGITDVLSLKILTRIGTNPDDTQCPGDSNASGLKVYFDSSNRPSRFGAVFIP